MKPTLLLLVQLAFGLCLFGQADDRRGNIRMAFYNVENFFDTTNDSLTLDDEFLPGTSHDWTPYRFRTKTHQLFQALAAVGGTEAPEIIGRITSYNVCYTKLLRIRYYLIDYSDYREVQTSCHLSTYLDVLIFNSLLIFTVPPFTGRTKVVLPLRYSITEKVSYGFPARIPMPLCQYFSPDPCDTSYNFV